MTSNVRSQVVYAHWHPTARTGSRDPSANCGTLKAGIAANPFSARSSLCTPRAMQFAVPGGLINVGTEIDPTLCRADRLVKCWV
ncbi:hypothetical protein F4604DRAFT_158358 [Suillus subluteus]|nr:hypothetical protein F4604DRAFT_158358 [Suillus subluteus]